MVPLRGAIVVALLLLCAVASGCISLRRFHALAFARCPASGPIPDGLYDRKTQPVDLAGYYRALEAGAAGVAVREVAQVRYEGNAFPLLHLGAFGAPAGPTLLVIAAVHGDEVSGSLAIPALLADAREHREAYAQVALHILAPANPVGLAHLSRYNGQGCDVNRDFGHFQTPEAAAIRDLIATLKPRLIVALHEGPQRGFYAIATPSVPAELARAAAHEVAAAGLDVATRSFLGMPLATPGVSREGWITTGMKRLIGLPTLGAYAHAHRIGVLTTESPWDTPDVAGRVQAHVIAVRAVAARLSPRPAQARNGRARRE